MTPALSQWCTSPHTFKKTPTLIHYPLRHNFIFKSFDAKLSPKESWAAHGVQPFALATDGETLYSSSNDGGIKVWSLTGDKIAELPSTGADVGALQVFDKQVYAGDEGGNVSRRPNLNLIRFVEDF